MPTYDYECTACQHKFEQFQSITAAPLRKCPECGKNKLKRLIGTGAGVIFKGSGFYITDYRSDSYKAAAKADGEKSSAAESGGSEKSSNAQAKPQSRTEASGQTSPAKAGGNGAATKGS